MTLLQKTNYTECVGIRDSKVLTRIPDQTLVVDRKVRFGFNSDIVRRGFGRKAPYDFAETYRILDTESYVSSAFMKKKTLILKDGFNLISKKEEDVQYIKRRFEEMQYVTGKSFKDFLEEVVSSFINNHNCFILVVRKNSSSSGNIRTIGRKRLQPIAGYYVLPESKITILEDEMGLPIGYKYQINNSAYKYFELDDILHLKFNVKPGYHVGTPPLEALVDDIIALRQIEESLERLIYKLSMPIIHAKVGTKEIPAGIDRLTGEKEVDQVNAALQHMEDAGGITTSERVEFKMLGAESQALRLSGYLEYFKNRVLVGLSMSDLDFGVANSTSAGSAEMVTKALKENVEMYQRKLEDFVTDRISSSLLLEKEDYLDVYYIEEDQKVKFKLNNDNIDNRIKKESHLINELNAYLITPDEYRMQTGKRPLTKEEKAELDRLSGRALKEDEFALAKQTAKETFKQKKEESEQKVDVSKTQGTNQHSDETVVSASKQPIKDSLGLERYVRALYNDASEMASTVLLKNLSKEIEDNGLKTSGEDLQAFVSLLTSSLQNYIIGKTTTDSTLSIVEKILCKKLLEVIDENV